MRRRTVAVLSLVIFFLVSAIVPQSALGGVLEGLEDGIKKKEHVEEGPGKEPEKKPGERPGIGQRLGQGDGSEETYGGNRSDGGTSSPGLFAEILAEILFEGALIGIMAGGVSSYERVTSGEREYGEPLIPFARLDLSVQNVNSDVTAWDSRAEFGFGPFGFQVRSTRYKEDEPDDAIEVLQLYWLYRMSAGPFFELDLALGSLTLDGDERHEGFSFSLPITVRPTERIGFEFRPAWANLNGIGVEDYDLAVSLGGRYVSLRIGYRWFMNWRSSLDGPYAGVSLYW